ncbi:MAG TPA: T9SS type A sorting domain-containing protein [Flavobacterium sp.]|jgi:hypothetical protein
MKNSISLIFIFLGLSTFDISAQVATYTFQNETHPFPYLMGEPNAVVYTHGITDDYVLPTEVTLPFVFNFGGSDHNAVNISENGFLWFGTATTATVNQDHPITSPQPGNLTGIISAMGIDLHPQYSGSDFTRIRSGYIGTQPSRTFVVEWYHTSRITMIDAEGGPDEMDFQIRLHEATNKVEVVYGRIKMNPLFSVPLQVGLKTTGNDYNLRTTANANWAQTLPAGEMNAQCILSHNSRPAPGQFMVWTPQPLSGDEHDLNHIAVYPVPATDALQITGIADASVNYSILDMTGRVVQQGIVQNGTINFINLSAGTYMVTLGFQDRKLYRKFIKI